MRWILESVEKLVAASQPPQQQQEDADQLQKLLNALKSLVHSRTTQHVIQAGRQIEQSVRQIMINNNDNDSKIPILERVVKATAMTGLLSISLNITTHLMQDCNHTPSTICQEAICQGLRKIGRVNQMEQFLLQVVQTSSAQVATTTSTPVSPFAYNLFLAALCDPIVDTTTDRTFWAPVDSVEYLQRARKWLDHSPALLRILPPPDSTSYATVLNAAAEMGNRTLADQVWNMAQQQPQKQHFSTQLVNARLKSLQQDDEAALQLYETWIQTNDKNNDYYHDSTVQKTIIQPDGYTVDFLLLPLLRAGRIGDVEQILDQFINYQSETVVADAFQAFLWTLVDKGNDVAAAKAIFDMYVGPALEPVISHASLVRLLRPRTRYFTILLEGYKRKLLAAKTAAAAAASVEKDSKQPSSEDKSSSDDNASMMMQSEQQSATTTMTPALLAEEAWKLYNLMRNSPLPYIQPDEFTISTMMSICQTSSELTELLKDSQGRVQMKGAVLRAAITAFGQVGDPSSACVLFAHHVPPELQSASPRYWNVLLGAIAKDESGAALDLANASIGTILSRQKSLASTNQQLLMQLDGLNSIQAAKAIVTEYVREPNSQTFALYAQVAASHDDNNSNLAIEIFRNATSAGIPADGRFVNAVLRCFGADIDDAVNAWKQEIRSACLAHENRARSKPVSAARTKGKNLVAAYHGLIYVAGRALCPDVALRLVYAMGKEGLPVDETALNCYKSGKRRARAKRDMKSEQKNGVRQRLRKLLNMVDAYESLLFVECVKYDQRDKRRSGDKKIRIII
eukprot:Sro987_g228280.2  (797) ;mRNA; f:31122-33512